MVKRGNAHNSNTFSISDFLSDDEKKTKLIEATLESYRKISSRIDIESIMMENFFGKVETFVFSDNVSNYFHNIMQYNLDGFLKELGFDLIEDFSIRDSEFLSQAKKIKVQCEENKFFDAYSDAYLFFENKELESKLCLKINKNYGNNGYYYEIFSDCEKSDLLIQWKNYSQKNNFYKGKKISADCSFLKINKNITWEDVIIDEKIKNVISENIEKLFSMSDALKKNGIMLKRGIIVEGSPGQGKTMICKVLIKELPVTILYVLPTHIHDRSDVARICDMAKDLSPTLLILEDIDYLAEDREGPGGAGWSVIDLMNKMDGIEGFENVVTLATTNLIEKVENAIKNRPGRFDRVISLKNPSKDGIVRMLKNFTQKFKVDAKINFEKMSEKLDKMSGAYIKDLCITAALLAIQENSVDENGIAILLGKHFIEALKEIKDKDFSQNQTFVENKPMGFMRGSSVSDDDDFA